MRRWQWSLCVCEAYILCRAHQQRWIDQLILPNLNENFSLFWEMVTVKKKRSMFLTKNHSLTLLSRQRCRGGGVLSKGSHGLCCSPPSPKTSRVSQLLAVPWRGADCAPWTADGSWEMPCSWLIHRLAQPSPFVPVLMFAFSNAGCIILSEDCQGAESFVLFTTNQS